MPKIFRSRRETPRARDTEPRVPKRPLGLDMLRDSDDVEVRVTVSGGVVTCDLLITPPLDPPRR